MRHLIVNGTKARLETSEAHFKYARESGESLEGDFSIEASGPGIYSVLILDRSYQVAISPDGSEVRVNGRLVPIEFFDPREMRGRGSKDATHGLQKIAAMMPGKVVRVLVAAGDAVEAGQGVIVVEAMKMQNEMKSAKAGRVIEVKTAEGATVAAGQILLVIE